MTTTNEKARAEFDREQYFRCMLDGLHETAARIEQKYGLYGYPPELVSFGLNAACKGQDAALAVEDHIRAGEDA